MVLVAYAGPVRPAAALRASVLCLPTDIHSLFVNKPSSSSSSSSSSSLALYVLVARYKHVLHRNRMPAIGRAPQGAVDRVRGRF